MEIIVCEGSGVKTFLGGIFLLLSQQIFPKRLIPPSNSWDCLGKAEIFFKKFNLIYFCLPYGLLFFKRIHFQVFLCTGKKFLVFHDMKPKILTKSHALRTAILIKMETFIGAGNIGFPSSLIFRISDDTAITAKLSREMRILSYESREVPPVVSLLYWSETWGLWSFGMEIKISSSIPQWVGVRPLSLRNQSYCTTPYLFMV